MAKLVQASRSKEPATKLEQFSLAIALKMLDEDLVVNLLRRDTEVQDRDRAMLVEAACRLAYDILRECREYQ